MVSLQNNRNICIQVLVSCMISEGIVSHSQLFVYVFLPLLSFSPPSLSLALSLSLCVCVCVEYSRVELYSSLGLRFFTNHESYTLRKPSPSASFPAYETRKNVCVYHVHLRMECICTRTTNPSSPTHRIRSAEGSPDPMREICVSV